MRRTVAAFLSAGLLAATPMVAAAAPNTPTPDGGVSPLSPSISQRAVPPHGPASPANPVGTGGGNQTGQATPTPAGEASPGDGEPSGEAAERPATSNTNPHKLRFAAGDANELNGHRLSGGILATWRKMGGATSILGKPASDVIPMGGGVYMAHFANGAIVWRGKAVVVNGAIYDDWMGHGGPHGSYGMPESTAHKLNAGAVQRFDKAAVAYKNGKLVHITGAVYKTWRSNSTTLGLPTAEMSKTHGAYMAGFDHGVIAYTSTTGAWPVTGKILTNWRARGGAASDAGLPIGPAGATQDFTHARLEVTSGGGVRTRVRLQPSIRNTTRADVAKTYRSGCPVGPSSLRTIDMNYHGFDGKVHRGQMVVHKNWAKRAVNAFTKGAWASFPIRHITNPNAYGGDDKKMIFDDNTSAFNCRKVTGNPYALSPHSYGHSIDINDAENPYNDGHRWWPNNKYVTQRHGKGVLTGKDPMTTAMVDQGFYWGGWWVHKDYQHFQKPKN